jgi:basic amino acid/polyamine antiporter, APA family
MIRLQEEQLKKVLRTPEVLLLGINGVIGGGIFLLPGQVAKFAGAHAVWAYLVAGFICILIGLCFSEAGGMFSRTGGAYVYAEEGLGRTAGFAVGWMSWLTYVAGWAALSNGFTVYLSSIYPGISPYKDLVIIVVVAGLCLLNTFGVKKGSWTINIFSIAKLIPLLLLVLIGLLSHFGNVDLHLVPAGTGHFGKAVLVLIFAYGGFEMATVPTGEMVNPKKTVAVAVLGTLTGVTLFYMLIQYAALRIDPHLATAKTPLASAGGMMFAGGLVVMTVGAAISILGTKSGVALSAPRTLYALSFSGSLPGFIARVHPKYKTPIVSIWVTGILVISFAVSGTFTTLILLNVAARVFAYLMVCLSVAVLRIRDKNTVRTFRLPFGITIPLASVVLCGWLLFQESLTQLFVAAIALVIGLLIFAATLAIKKQEPDEYKTAS